MKPKWLRQELKVNQNSKKVKRVLVDQNLHTICEEARCPNRGKCYADGQATFLIMGDSCTRNCNFCAVNSEGAQPLDCDEPSNIAQAVKELQLEYVVITSVTRDDLPDGGASHFAETIEAIREHKPSVRVEVLTPDFKGDRKSLSTVFTAQPDVFNHNVETISRLYPKVRQEASYSRSLRILSLASKRDNFLVKSGFMVGLGESNKEVLALLDDLREAGCDIITIGQYLQPSPDNLEVQRYVEPEVFEEYKEYGEKIGIKSVLSAPLVRSSFKAKDVWRKLA